jgi:MOSC domain-containing protein YiiM
VEYRGPVVRDFETLRVIAETRGSLDTTEKLARGVCARVVSPGRVRIGDAIRVVS